MTAHRSLRVLRREGSPIPVHASARITRSPRIAGYRVHGDKLYPGVWEPIIDVETWSLLMEHYGGEMVTAEDGSQLMV